MRSRAGAAGARDIWDANHAGGVTAASPAEIAEVFEACERLLPAGVRHRQFRYDPLTPPPFVAHLEWAGLRCRPLR